MTDENTDPPTNPELDDTPQAPSGGLVVTVPSSLYAPPGLDAETVTTCAEAASGWDSRIWRPGVPSNW